LAKVGTLTELSLSELALRKLSQNWPWPLAYDLEIKYGAWGYHGRCFCVISSSWVQRFLRYLG